MRKALNKKRDRSIFRRMSNKTKKVNIAPKQMRGGIRF